MQRPISWTYLVTLLCFVFASSTSANAFTTQHKSLAVNPTSPLNKARTFVPPSPPSTATADIMSSKAMSTNGGGEAKPAPPKRIRISAFDSMRFFLIAFICTGHFIRFADPSPLVMNIFGQINVVVGAFFVLSGYVTAYTSTTVGAYEASPKLKPAPAWILSRVFGYFPLHVIVLALFSPIFLYADVTYNGWFTSMLNGLLSVTMTQAWFPMHAEIWNAPTWFLSALTFATATMPFALPSLATMTPPQLRKTMLYLTGASLLPKLGYSYDHNVWGVLEGSMAPKAFPNLAIFNNQRFNPFFATVEVLLGAAACRLVMLDGVDDKEKTPQTSLLSTLGPLVGMVTVIVLRAMEILKLNDMLTRTLIFLPLFLQFMMAAHRVAVAEANDPNKSKDMIVSFLSSKYLTTLGNLAFPIFLVHGPIGQIFYKKIIAKKLFGGTLNTLYGANFFYVYLAAVVGTAAILKKLVLDNATIGSFSKKTAAAWSKDL
jgi:peptidoglycan/LPS O-acetylase OafA/YrhL